MYVVGTRTVKTGDSFNPRRTKQDNIVDAPIINILKQLPNINYYMIFKKIRCKTSKLIFCLKNNYSYQLPNRVPATRFDIKYNLSIFAIAISNQWHV